MFKLKLHWQILIAIVLALIAGSLAGKEAGIFGVSFYSMFEFVGSLFLNALKMLIVPLIVSSIIVGIAGLGSSDSLGRLGGKTILYYMTTSLIAILIGLTLVNIMQPGIIDGQPAKEALDLQGDIEEIKSNVEGRGAGDIVQVFLRMIPTNIVAAAADGQMLGLIFFSLMFGYFMTKIKQKNADLMFNFWDSIYHVMMHITDLVMLFAPIGVFALVAKVVASTGFGAIAPLLWFFFTVLFALLLHFAGAMPILLALVGRIKNPWRQYQAMAPAILTAFSTSSSSATLPITMECVEKNAGVSNRTSSFVLPLGATINMDGTALYECVAAMFIAQAYGIELGFTTQLTVVIVALLTSIGVAGIPSASLVAISIILATIGLPIEAIGLILAVDRILDMCRTAVNVFSDSCGAVIIARTEGEEDILTGKPTST